MLASLRHHRIIGRDDQEREIEPRCAREHVADEPLVARHVNERQVIIAQLERRESQIDGDSALFLSGQPIGIDPRQGAHERCLTVVNMPGSAQHQVACAVVHC